MRKTTKSVVVVAVISLVLVAGYYYVVGGVSQENPNEFGSWRQQVFVVYDDESMQPLNIAFPSLTVYHDGKIVTGVRYFLDAKTKTISSGEYIELDFNNYNVVFEVSTQQHVYKYSGGNPTVPCDGQYHNIISTEVSISQITSSLPDGTYTLAITPTGTADYRSSGDWIPLTLPLPVSTEITITTYSPPPPSEYEMLDTYEHGGETTVPPYISIGSPAHIAMLTNAPRQATAYLRKTGTSSMGEFGVTFKIIITRMDDAGVGTGSGFIAPMFSRVSTATTYRTAAGTETLSLFFRTWDRAPLVRLVNHMYSWNTEYGTGPEMYLQPGYLNRPLYIKMWRDSSKLNVAFYDDVDFTNPSVYVKPNVASLTLPDTAPYLYFLPLTTRGTTDTHLYLASCETSKYKFN